MSKEELGYLLNGAALAGAIVWVAALAGAIVWVCVVVGIVHNRWQARKARRALKDIIYRRQ